MVTEERMKTLFTKSNPVADEDASGLDPMSAAAYLETLEKRSNEMTQLDTATPASVEKRRPIGAMLAGAAAVVVIGVLGVVIALTGGEEDDGVLSSEDFYGLWQSNDGVYVQFNEDGTKTAAWTLDELPDGTLEQGTWSFDGTEFVWANGEADGTCTGVVARYNVEQVADDTVQWNVIWDECLDRLSDMQRGPMRRLSG